MVSTRRNRILLIALLPIMAAVLYLEGQQYDPALIQFSPSEYGSGGEASFFPPEVAGYRRSGQLRRYTRENLYEYVNGHAEYFISAGFAGLTVGEYVREGGNPDQPEAVVDIYDMEKGIQAFGILSDEGGEDAENMEAGNMGFKTDQVVGFIKGRYYVKINRFDEQAPLEQLAREIDWWPPGSSRKPIEGSTLPTTSSNGNTASMAKGYRSRSLPGTRPIRQNRLRPFATSSIAQPSPTARSKRRGAPCTKCGTPMRGTGI
jgi:hypothetical protein